MENVLYPKFQFEVRYTHILNFTDIVREILSHYLKLTTSFNIANQGMLEETIRLNFDEDTFAIEFRWDRAFIIGERDINRFDDENSSVKVFFEILTKLRDSSSFGKFTTSAYIVYLIKISDDSRDKILSDFREKYFKSSIDYIIDKPDDLAIVLEKRGMNNRLESVNVGPYSHEDIAIHNLLPFNSIDELSNKQGKMVQLKIIENINSVNSKTFKELIKFTKKYSDYLQSL